MSGGRPIKSLESARYGRLTPGQHLKGQGWLCRCDCGESKIVTGNHLRSGAVVSCGCFHEQQQRAPKLHGMRRTRAWAIWSLMVQRCTNPRNPAWPNYGGRGIRVCVEWMQFASFIRDMGPPPEGLTLERINNERGYEPGNCRWATRTEQARNKRTNRIVELGGVSMPLVVWCELLGLKYWTVHARLRRGATEREALLHG